RVDHRTRQRGAAGSRGGSDAAAGGRQADGSDAARRGEKGQRLPSRRRAGRDRRRAHEGQQRRGCFCRAARTQEQVLMRKTVTAAEIIARLALKPHPEGGHYRETFRDAQLDGNGRSASTAIYFLLARGERSHWHRIDASETWHHYAGSALLLEIADPDGRRGIRLGSDLAAGEQPQVVVP